MIQVGGPAGKRIPEAFGLLNTTQYSHPWMLAGLLARPLTEPLVETI